LSPRKWLEYYAAEFDIVELNASFYRIPKASVTEGWKSRSPDNFGFSIKFPRLITHYKKLSNCEDTVEWFFREMEPLKKKIEVFLIQLPPAFIPERSVLETFISMLPEQKRYVFELRAGSIEYESISAIFRKLNIGLCVHDLADYGTPFIVTTDFIYVRFHGYELRYAGEYPDAVLDKWARIIEECDKKNLDVFVFFNNDAEANAVRDARRLKAILGL
jgi:uncharacterized protein YecE (DUF72 family)